MCSQLPCYRDVTDVVLSDEFDTEAFEITFGSLPAHWDSIAAGSNVTHVVVAQPRSTGEFNVTSGSVSYKAAADQEPVVRCRDCTA